MSELKQLHEHFKKRVEKHEAPLKAALERAKQDSALRTRTKDTRYKLSHPNKAKKLYKASDHLRRKESNDYERAIHGQSSSLSHKRMKEIEDEDRDYHETRKHPDQR